MTSSNACSCCYPLRLKLLFSGDLVVVNISCCVCSKVIYGFTVLFIKRCGTRSQYCQMAPCFCYRDYSIFCPEGLLWTELTVNIPIVPSMLIQSIECKIWRLNCNALLDEFKVQIHDIGHSVIPNIVDVANWFHFVAQQLSREKSAYIFFKSNSIACYER